MAVVRIGDVSLLYTHTLLGDEEMQ
jgi:hypothetical protein